jgi:hypothetical protein
MGPTIFFATEHIYPPSADRETQSVFLFLFSEDSVTSCGQTFLLLHADCLYGTGVNADTAINAGVWVNDGFVVSHTYCLAGAFFHTGFTTSAFSPVYFSRHLYNPFNEKPDLPREIDGNGFISQR